MEGQREKSRLEGREGESQLNAPYLHQEIGKTMAEVIEKGYMRF